MKCGAIIKDGFLITLGSILYALSTNLFVFPCGLLLGGTSGIAVILTGFLPYSAGTISAVLNSSLIILAFFVLGRDMAVKTFVGSLLTTIFIKLFEAPLTFDEPIVANPYIAVLIGAAIIAIASGIMFYVDSSSGGTDIVALIVKKFSHIQIGKALLITDVLIVLIGGALQGVTILLASVLGLLLKSLGIDFVIFLIKKFQSRKGVNVANSC